jgi:hypothetical protein
MTKPKDWRGVEWNVPRTQGMSSCRAGAIVLLAALMVVLSTSCRRRDNWNSGFHTISGPDEYGWALWGPTGSIYFLSWSDNHFQLWRLNPWTGERQALRSGLNGPFAESPEGRIAVTEGFDTVVLLDFQGREIWRRSFDVTLNHLAFSRLGDGLYVSVMGDLLFVPLDDPARTDTIARGIGPFCLADRDSFLVYGDIVSDTSGFHYFMHMLFLKSGRDTVVLTRDHVGGFDLNPRHPAWLAVEGYNEVIVHNLLTGAEIVLAPRPYDSTSVRLNTWSPDGSDLLLTVGQLVGEGFPLWIENEELWVADDVIEDR